LTAQEERRREPRLPREERIFVKILWAVGDDSLAGKTYYCSTQDVSARGLKIRTEHDIPTGCAVCCWIGALDSPGTVVLNGEVKWAKRLAKEDAFLVGVELRPEPEDEFRAWNEIVMEKMQSEQSW